jgi:hypothetical protein
VKNSKTRIDIAFDKNAPSKLLGFLDLAIFKDFLARGGKIRCLTKITSDNIQYCKKLSNLVSELRHIDDFCGGLVISESEYMTNFVFSNELSLSRVVYCNENDMVRQGQCIFENLWKNSVSAFTKIDEIEKGKPPGETKILSLSHDRAKIENLVSKFFKSQQLRICISTSDSQTVYKLLLPLTKSVMDSNQKNNVQRC